MGRRHSAQRSRRASSAGRLCDAPDDLRVRGRSWLTRAERVASTIVGVVHLPDLLSRHLDLLGHSLRWHSSLPLVGGGPFGSVTSGVHFASMGVPEGVLADVSATGRDIEDGR